ncbi:hypothetical protein SKUD_206915 [Saccharomyces kudriavzevii IFO 1802]|uniref:Uncharacterized protein n=1 Tax=Saccharomyces kudriavzevii (strain ATCC MYA-4449 / AS 2.2408 / CBS 8840 / NBRC 1802 / NCYC 2889) TaxID=226230 RepID=J4TXV9_SACK1|nr:hypothetical protein SKUD_206915 [Saccharomyces kudriavzevii IFO 1802]
MATPVRDETRNVTDDNISTQVQSKVKTIDTVHSTQLSIKELSIEDDQMEEDLKELTKFKRILNVLRQEEEKLSKTDDVRTVVKQMLENSETIEKVKEKIQKLINRIKAKELEKITNILHAQIDATGTYFLFDTLTLKNRKFYPKDSIFYHKLSNIGNVPIFLNNFQQYIKKYEFDDVFDKDIQNIDPRENEILCKIIKEGLTDSLDVMNTFTSDIFRIIHNLKIKYQNIYDLEKRSQAWKKVLVDTTCRDSELLMNELQKLVLMEKWVFSECCQNCPNLAKYLKEAILGTLHESLRNPVKQRLYNHEIDQNMRYEELLVNTVIEAVRDLGPISSDHIEKDCRYCKSVFHSSVNCKLKPNRELRPTTFSYSKGNYSQGSTQKEYTKTGTNPVKTFEKTKEEEQKGFKQKPSHY